jgi:hypothetical protein
MTPRPGHINALLASHLDVSVAECESRKYIWE